MFYRVELKDHIRVAPRFFDLEVKEAVLKSVRLKYNGLIDSDLGFVIAVTKVNEVGEGVIIPGDGASYYITSFVIITYRPELQELIAGKVKDIADFGAFLTLGPVDGMIHIGQTMDDFVSFSKEKVLTGRDSKRLLKVGDLCRARIIAVSFKDITNPKIGLTMRQPGLGKVEWIEEDEKPKEVKAPANAKKAKKKKAKK